MLPAAADNQTTPLASSSRALAIDMMRAGRSSACRSPAGARSD
jgi:hypothetical protein